MRRPSVDRRLVAACGTGLLVRLALVVLGTGTDRFRFFDAPDYELLSTHFPSYLSARSGRLATMSMYRTPIYPAFQWATSFGDPHRYTLIVLAQCVLGGVVNVALTWWLARRLFGARTAMVAAVLVAVDPVSAAHALYLGTETLATTAVLLTVIALVVLRDRSWSGATAGVAVLVGLVAAASAFVRPTQMYLILVVVGLALGTVRGGPAPDRGPGRPIRAAAWAAAGLVLVGAVVPVTAWALRNRSVGGRTTFSTIQGENISLYALGALDAEHGRVHLRYDAAEDKGLVTSDEGLRYLRRWDAQAAADVGARPGQVPPDVVAGPRYGAAWNQRYTVGGLRVLAHHPRGAVILGAYGTARIVGAPGATAPIELLRPSLRTTPVKGVIWAWAVGWLLVVDVGALVGTVVLARRRRWWTAAVVALPAAFCILFSAGSFAYVRFRVPVSPLLCVLAAVALVALADRRTPSSGQTTAA